LFFIKRRKLKFWPENMSEFLNWFLRLMILSRRSNKETFKSKWNTLTWFLIRNYWLRFFYLQLLFQYFYFILFCLSLRIQFNFPFRCFKTRRLRFKFCSSLLVLQKLCDLLSQNWSESAIVGLLSRVLCAI